MADDSLYEIDIQYTVSPAELKAFCDMLEENNYEVVTDLGGGKIEIHEGGDDNAGA